MTRELIEHFSSRAQSFLTDDHIRHTVAAYEIFGDENGNNLSIPLYVRTDNANGNGSA